MSAPERVSTGIEGLDSILDGGLIEGRGYMVDGPPGVGKTILTMHFLSAGLVGDETVLFINLEEDLTDLKSNATSLGFDVESMEFLDLSPTAEVFTEDRSYEVFSAAEVEQAPLTEEIRERVREVEPDRVVVDPLTQLRYLTSDDYQFRKQIIGFMRFLKEYGATVLFTVQDTDAMPTEDLQFISDGTILLDRVDDRETVAVPKFRGSAVRRGEHTAKVTDDGLEVYPALEPGNHRVAFEAESVSSGVPEVDELLYGGLERGTVSIISGATGVGKTTLGTQFMKEAAGRGERSVIYLFEESEQTFLERSGAINIPVGKMIDRGTLEVVEIEGMETTPQEFATMVREEVEEDDTKIVMIDGTVGYRQTLRGEREAMTQHLHALGRYLKNMGVTTILVEETGSVVGEFHATDSNLSYLADNIVFLRHLELHGELRKAIGVLKKRTTDFERTLREYEITRHGIKVGDPLRRLRGVLSGTPEVVERRDDSDEE
jgi:circadian clock protein KaiC